MLSRSSSSEHSHRKVRAATIGSCVDDADWLVGEGDVSSSTDGSCCEALEGALAPAFICFAFFECFLPLLGDMVA